MGETIDKSLTAMNGQIFTAQDSYANLNAKIGNYPDLNLFSKGDHYRDQLTLNQDKLTRIYRESWVAARAIDTIAEDMTKKGITIESEASPGDIDKVQGAYYSLGLWRKLEEAIKWSRLFGGACLFIMVAEQDPETELRPETVGPGQFLGVRVFDRWQLEPVGNERVVGGPRDGEFMFYSVTAGPDTANSGIIGEKIHYTRLVRFIGDDLPAWERPTVNYWGASVLEKFYDRIKAFDEVTMHTASLISKAHLRRLGIPNLRNILGGQENQALQDGLYRMMEQMRLLQSNQGITLTDAEDQYQADSYTYSGLSDIHMVFIQQIAGAIGIPLIRLLGQTPGGLNTSGDGEWRNYYDQINTLQSSRLRDPITQLNDVIWYSENGSSPPEGTTFRFVNLFDMKPQEASAVAASDSQTVMQAYSAGQISDSKFLKELKGISQRVGTLWHSVTDEDIKAAEELEAPALPSLMETDPEKPMSERILSLESTDG